MALVELSRLRKRYGDNEVVAGLDLAIADGEVLCLLGPSGCGKTTTLRMIAGLETPSSGEIRIGKELVFGAGRSVPPEKRRLGMVFQSYAVWPHMDVVQNVSFPLRTAGIPAQEARERAFEALRQVRLDGLEARYPHELSGGQQQRVALARALVAEPRVLLLDEPLSNLDAKLRAEMREEIRALVKKIGVTVVLVTHDQEEALALSDRIALMEHGVIQQAGAPEVLYESPQNARVARFVGTLNELDGEVDGDEVLLFGVRVPAISTEDAPQFGPCSLGFRPEEAEISPLGIVAVVEARVYLGHEVRYRLRVGERRVVVRGRAGIREGDRVRFEIRRGFVLGGPRGG